MADEFNIEFQEGGVVHDGDMPPEQIEQIVRDYLSEHPIDTLSESDVTKIVSQYMSEHPASGGVDTEEVNTIISEYLTNHPVSGVKGDKGDNGADGKSAYDIAVENGYNGTESEWLASLKGEKGQTGGQGKSAYVIAKENGYNGTESEWLASLKGAKGDSVTDEEISQLIGVYMNENPIETINTTDVENAVVAAVGGQLSAIEAMLQNIGTGGESPFVIEGLSVGTLPTTQMFEPTDTYKGVDAVDHILENCPSLADFYSLYYDTYLNRNIPNYTVTKKSLGKDQSNTYDLWEYDFCPSGWERMILLSSGMNGYEIAATFGLAYFMKQIIENHDNDAVLSYLFRKVRIKVLPQINPWGYAQNPKMYTQSRGVNINRNFDIDGKWAAYPTYPTQDSNPNNNKGEAPFSEAETQILRNWAEENAAAEFWIDCHTAASGYTTNKALYTSQISTSVLHEQSLKAQSLLVAWTKAFYNLSSVATKFEYDSNGAIKQYWYEGTFHKGMLVIEQCSDCAAIGNTQNGSANAIYNYFMLIYAHVGCYLERAERTIADKDSYIKTLLQDYLNAQKYYTPHEIEREEVVQKTLSRITATKTKRAYEVGETFSTSDITTTAYYSDNTSAVVVGTINAASVDTSTVGTYTVNVSYTEDGITKTATITITVADSSVTPPPTDDSIAILKQGTLGSPGGLPVEAANRVYIENYFAIPNKNTFSMSGLSGNGRAIFARYYDENYNFLNSVKGNSSSGSGIYWNNSTGLNANSDITFTKQINSTEASNAKYIRFVIKKTDDANISPSDLNGISFTFDGVTYTLGVENR